MDRAPIGPGRLVLVVGPSGAGKDTLIRAARERLSHDPAFVFPRRIVTRPSSEAEDNDWADPETFRRSVAAGGFAIHWQAHGLDYGIPAEIDDAVGRGLTVICNVSRTVVTDQRARYADVLVIEVTAPRSVLAERLVRRGRSHDGDLTRRIARSEEAAGRVQPDISICNAGPLDQACETFLDAIDPERGRAALRSDRRR